MIDYGIIEDDIKQRLQPLQTAGVDVVVLPEFQDQFKQGVVKNRVTIAYKHSEFADPKTSFGFQEQTLFFNIQIEHKRLRKSTLTVDGGSGVYPVSKAVREMLFGYKPVGCSQGIWLVKDGWPEHTHVEGVWTYILLIGVKVQAVKSDENIIEYLITQIKHDVEICEDVTEQLTIVAIPLDYFFNFSL